MSDSVRSARPEIGFAAVAAAAMIAAQVGGRASRDALFLSHFPATDLPPMMMSAAVVSLLAALGFSAALGRFGPARLIPLGFATSGLALVGVWALVRVAPGPGAVALYLHMAAFGAALISGFWSVINERFDPHTARRTISRIGAAAAGGGLLGGLGSERLASLLGIEAMLLAVAALHVVAALSLRGVGAPADRLATAASASGLGALRRTPYLQQMAALVAMLAVIDALLDYALKSEAKAAFATGAGLVRFFVAYYTLTGLLGFVAQVTLGSRVLRKYGIGGAMLTLPIGVISASALAALWPRLASVVMARVVGAVASQSLFRSGFELLYTPLSPELKRPAKVFVDVGSQRVGDLLGSGLVFGLLLLPVLPIRSVVVLAAATAAGVLLAVLALQRGYVEQLAGSLKSGQVHLGDEEIADATTARTVAGHTRGLDRESVLAMIRERQRRREAAAGGAEPEAREPASLGDLPAVMRRAIDLERGEPERVRRALEERPLDLRLVPFVLALLPRAELREPALAFLRRAAPRIAGQLVDALLDARSAPGLRQGVAGLLESCDDARALEGLRRALVDLPTPADPRAALEEFEVRRRCAQAAARIVARRPALRLEPAQVYAAVRRELSVSDELWEEQSRVPASASSSVLLDVASARTTPSTLEHLFTLLSLAFEREVMASTLAGLLSDDENLRGTALEYLDMTLPGPVFQAFVARLERRPAPPRGARRPAGTLADELLRSASGSVLDVDRLRGR